MEIQKIKISDLHINPTNDRHGELMDETTAIEWLLTHRAKHMRNLTKDIVEAGEVYEPPLVRMDGESYRVFDGNRRSTVLKLLAKPEMAPSTDWSEFFSQMRTSWKGQFPDKIDCQVEKDLERVDAILYRRHTGQKNGVGQSQWDAEAKSNFEKRTGKSTKIDISEEIEKILHASGGLRKTERIPRSNLKRLLSAEKFRNRVGITLERNRLNFTHSEPKVLSALERIARDLISKKTTLDDIWDNSRKRAYLDGLSKEGVLPTIEDAIVEPIKIEPKKKNKTSDGKQDVDEGAGSDLMPSGARQALRIHLIRNIDYNLIQTQSNRRVFDIFGELQTRLRFEDHGNAISVLFRVLVELSIENYIENEPACGVNSNEKLGNKFRKVADHMFKENSIDKNYRGELKKFEQNEIILSTNTLHKYIHSSNFFPSDVHMRSMWDNLEKFVVICIKR